MRGKSIAYLLAAALAAVCAGGCAHQPWSGPIPFNTVVSQQRFDDSSKKFLTHIELEILSLQKMGDDKTIYSPSGEQETLWLQPGEYRAKIKCDEAPSGTDDDQIMKPENALRSDQMFDFSLKVEPDWRVQYLRCKVDHAGKVYVALLETDTITVD